MARGGVAVGAVEINSRKMRGEGCESPSSGNSRPSLPDVSGVGLLTRKQFSSGTRSRVGGLRARPRCAACPKGKALREGGGGAVSSVPVPDGKRGDAGRRHAAGQCWGVLVGRSVDGSLVGERLVPSRSVLEVERRRPVVFEAGRLSGVGGGGWFRGERSVCVSVRGRGGGKAAAVGSGGLGRDVTRLRFGYRRRGQFTDGEGRCRGIRFRQGGGKSSWVGTTR